MDEVAKRSGASRPLLYHYFSSKQELIRAVVAHESATLAGSIDSAKLPEALDAYLDYVESHPHGYRLLHGGPLQADREVKTTVEQTRTLIENEVISHLGIEKPTELTRLAVRGWTGYVIAVCMEWAAATRPAEMRSMTSSSKRYRHRRTHRASSHKPQRRLLNRSEVEQNEQTYQNGRTFGGL